MIKPKEKKCKGTGIARGYGCGELKLERVYGLGKYCCYNNWLLNSPEGKKKLNKITLKVAAPRLSLQKSEKELKDKTETTKALNNTKKQVHTFVNKRDKFKPCISCGCQWNKQFEAGHLFSANNYRSIKFNLYNINGQCYECNHLKNGNEGAYLINLPERIGQESTDELIRLATLDKQTNKHWTATELKEIRDHVKQLTKEL
jgi:hypothetical protein